MKTIPELLQAALSFATSVWLGVTALYATVGETVPEFALSPFSALMFTAHILANGGIFAVCICRLGKMHHKALLRVKFQYIMMLVAAAANGMSPLLFRQFPSSAGVAFAVVVLFMLWSDGYQWKRGLPEAASSDFTPLETPHAHR